MLTWRLSFNTGNIKLGKRIGHGAQAEIFKAKCGLDDVVVKRFLDSKHKSTKQEVAIIQQLTHKHIVQFYHVHHEMIVMEYVEGGDLAAVIVGKALKNWEVKTQIAKDISLGLAYLHDQGIIHCDIKSSNILLTEHKEAKICDFGVAIQVGDSDGGGGTLQWMAPEELRFPPQHSSKSDVYALGMVMWEMASESTQPYRGHIPDGVMCCILGGILETIPGDTPEAYAACIRRCWAMDPDNRPAAMDLLPEAVQSSPGQDAPDPQQPRNVTNNGKMVHYLKALEKSFKKNESSGFLDLLKNGGMLDDNKTMDWFESSAGGQGSAKAMLKMGHMHYRGRGAPLDYGEALEWYLAASEAGIAVALLMISQIYHYGRGVDQDDEKAKLWDGRCEEALQEQDRLNNRMVHHGAGVSEHHTRTMEWFSNSVEGEAAETYRQIGRMYYDGEDLEQDYGKAMKWYLKAGDGGDATAMFNLGVMYRIGQGVEQDYSKAMEWYLKASDSGHASPMKNIGIMYHSGHGVEQDYSKATEWYIKASNAGDLTVMGHIGAMYHGGYGVEQDYGKAMEWYLKASDTGHAASMDSIGNMHREGQGVEQDYGKAMEWHLRASDSGYAVYEKHRHPTP
ncbi:hypothetical protein BGZ75_005325 [Mortierella antarctica]|nr:hypothetical protein BGZ75_005325 [Mortierella antarctica]